MIFVNTGHTFLGYVAVWSSDNLELEDTSHSYWDYQLHQNVSCSWSWLFSTEEVTFNELHWFLSRDKYCQIFHHVSVEKWVPPLFPQIWWLSYTVILTSSRRVWWRKSVSTYTSDLSTVALKILRIDWSRGCVSLCAFVVFLIILQLQCCLSLLLWRMFLTKHCLMTSRIYRHSLLHVSTRSRRHNLTLLLRPPINDQFDLATRQHRFQSLSSGILWSCWEFNLNPQLHLRCIGWRLRLRGNTHVGYNELWDAQLESWIVPTHTYWTSGANTMRFSRSCVEKNSSRDTEQQCIIWKMDLRK